MNCCLSFRSLVSTPVVVISRANPATPSVQANSSWIQSNVGRMCMIAGTGLTALANLVVAFVPFKKGEDVQGLAQTLVSATLPLFMNAVIARLSNQETPLEQESGVFFKTMAGGFSFFPSLLFTGALLTKNDPLASFSKDTMPYFLGLSVLFRCVPELERCVDQRHRIIRCIQSNSICNSILSNKRIIKIALAGIATTVNLVLASTQKDSVKLIAEASQAITWPLFLHTLFKNRPLNEQTECERNYGIVFKAVALGCAIVPTVIAAASGERNINFTIGFAFLSGLFRITPEVYHLVQSDDNQGNANDDESQISQLQNEVSISEFDSEIGTAVHPLGTVARSANAPDEEISNLSDISQINVPSTDMV